MRMDQKVVRFRRWNDRMKEKSFSHNDNIGKIQERLEEKGWSENGIGREKKGKREMREKPKYPILSLYSVLSTTSLR